MERLAKDRPTSVTVIGWIFTGLAGLMIFSGVMGFVTFTFMKQAERKDFFPIPDNLSGHFKILWSMFQYYDVLAVLQILFALIVMIAAIQFLKLRAWARTALESISWLGLVWVVGFGIFWILSWMKATSGVSVSEMASRPPPLFGVVGIVMGAAVTAIWAVPLMVIIRFLRGSGIREAVTGARG